MRTSYLVTGAAGFIGSNFLEYFISENPDAFVVSLDALTYAADIANIKPFLVHKRHEFITGNICNADLIRQLFINYNFQGVFHFAAESHVDNSITSPEEFIKTNIVGTFTLINEARRAWMLGPFEKKPEFNNARFLHVSTDEVYGSLGETGLFSENTPYAPNSPYSASKASSDFLVRSFFHTYGLNAVTTNCSNNYGPRQHGEKLIPTVIRNALSENEIPIYGNGQNIRDWIYVLDHCIGLNLAFKQGRAGEAYNIGGRNELTNLELVEYICTILDQERPRKSGSYKNLIKFVNDRPGHDKRYAIDATKIEKELGWSAHHSLESGIRKTISWYLEKYKP